MKPRKQSDGQLANRLVVVLVLHPWQIRSADGRAAGPGERALLAASEAHRLAAAAVVTLLDEDDTP